MQKGENMKATLIGFVLSTVTIVVSAGNPDYINFVVKQAHSVGFTGCDDAIRSVFRLADGSDIRVNADWFDDIKDDTLKLTATWGDKGDSIFREVEFTKRKETCYSTITTILTTDKSCIAYANEMKAFEFMAQTVDYTWMRNSGGLFMLLKPLNTGCIAIFQQGTNKHHF
jgi:hypothetical protein